MGEKSQLTDACATGGLDAALSRAGNTTPAALLEAARARAPVRTLPGAREARKIAAVRELAELDKKRAEQLLEQNQVYVDDSEDADLDQAELKMWSTTMT